MRGGGGGGDDNRDFTIYGLGMCRFYAVKRFSSDRRKTKTKCSAWLPQVRKWSGKKQILQGQGNVREFYSGSRKIGILKESQRKLKL